MNLKCLSVIAGMSVNENTEIASGFTVANYRILRAGLDISQPTLSEWKSVRDAFRRRINERFLEPIAHLESRDDERPLPFRAGFAILTLDCVLIDMIQSFREGRQVNDAASSASSFKFFLKSPAFSEFKSGDREDFYSDVRCGLVHNAETRKNWKVRIDTPNLLTKDTATGTITINRRMFHAAVRTEVDNYCATLEETGPTGAITRENFLKRMDELCSTADVLFFAYGSLMNESEIAIAAPAAMSFGRAVLPGYRFGYTKHSIKWGGDAASVSRDPSSVVWGYVYLLSEQDKRALIAREKGYAKQAISVLLPDAGWKGQDAFTFVGEKVCESNCGPTSEYAALVREAAISRGLPEEFFLVQKKT